MVKKEGSLIIEGSKLIVVRMLLVGVALVAVGTLLIIESRVLVGAFSIFLGLIPLTVGVIQLRRGSYLKLDQDGFEVCAGIKKPWRHSWNDVESFYVITAGLFIFNFMFNKYIGYNFSASYSEMMNLSDLSRKRVLANSFKLSTEKACELLNEWKEKYGAAN